jgi:hypothetical protein
MEARNVIGSNRDVQPATAESVTTPKKRAYEHSASQEQDREDEDGLDVPAAEADEACSTLTRVGKI